MSIKARQLFYNTNRTPEYDVISIIAPTRKQHVTFYFDQKVSSNGTMPNLINKTYSTTDPFYDQLNIMTLKGTCMYLNIMNMTWQSDGCSTNQQLSNSSSVTCTCEHLTIFTVFFSLSCATSPQVLDILSWVGCILSIFSLSTTLIIFLVSSLCRQTKQWKQGLLSTTSNSSQKLRRRITVKEF